MNANPMVVPGMEPPPGERSNYVDPPSQQEVIVAVALFHDIEIVARLAMFFTKASIVLLYYRLFIPDSSKRTGVWWAIWFVFWWNLLYTVALVLTVTTDCVGKGDKVAKGEECVNQSAVVICATVINVVSDLMILIIPIAAIWGLQIAKTKKLRLSAVFATSTAKIVINSFFANRRGLKPSASDIRSEDPSRFREYEELDEVESQRELATPVKGTSVKSVSIHHGI
ncbi:MAG: hypothetical protein Q9181_006047 [Wetmoreana brouardii]